MDKKTTTAFVWDFPSTGGGEEHGFADSQLEHFQGDHERYIAREAIQNAVDARKEYDKPVTVVFERFDLPVSDLPGAILLKGKMVRCLSFVENQLKAEEFFKKAIDLLNGKKLSVLKISDFNTVGLSGADRDREGGWYRLVRAAGTSSPKGVQGGSFGIGKGAPIAASALRTVFYSSVNDKDELVFQGKARLVSHYGNEKDVRQGVGFCGLAPNGREAIRDGKSVPKAFRRTERGTDIFVIGYKADGDWKEKIIASVLYNFWLAIHTGNLEVIVQDGERETINKKTLADFFERYEAGDARYYYEAVMNPNERFDEDSKHLGKMTLYVKKQEGYPSKVMMARKPKMFVQDKGYRVLREPYAGVFVCEDDRGNALLRDLEPPAHDKWDKNRAPNGWAALIELDEFIKRSLKSMGQTINTELQDIPGLDKYLPDSEDRDHLSHSADTAMEETEESTDEESGREVGASRDLASAGVESVMRKAAVVKAPATGVGGSRGPANTADGGSDAGGSGGTEEGEGVGERIRTADISFRSFVQKSKGGLEYHFIITGREECQGSVRIIAIGDDGSYPVDVAEAKIIGSKQKCETNGSFIKNLSIGSGETIKLVVHLQSKRKYALGIENYEG